MIERLVFVRGAWIPAHRASSDCWCRPTLRERGDGFYYNVHNYVPCEEDTRQRAFISGPIEAPQ